MLSEEALKAYGPACVGLHGWYMEQIAKGETDFHGVVAQSYFKDHGDLELHVAFNDLYDLSNLGGLDVSLLRCWTL